MIEVVVTTIAGILVIVNTVVSNRARQHAQAARVQVENNHRNPETGEVINLREEADERHEENSSKLDSLVRWTERADDRFATVERRLATLRDRNDVHEDRIDELEKTQPPTTRRTPHE